MEISEIGQILRILELDTARFQSEQYKVKVSTQKATTGSTSRDPRL